MQTYQSSFTAGELSPSLLGRIDLARYQSGCKTLNNMLVHPQGGASKRPGFEYVAELPGDAHLLPFIFSNEQSYVLAFTDYELRIYTRAGVVEEGDSGNWQDSEWKNETGSTIQVPPSGLFSMSSTPAVSKAAVATAILELTGGSLVSAELYEAFFNLSGANVTATLRVETTQGQVFTKTGTYTAGSNRRIFVNFDVTRTAKKVTLTFSSYSNAVITASAEGRTALPSHWRLFPWSSAWQNQSQSPASASSPSSTNVRLYGKTIPQADKIRQNKVFVETPGAELPIRLDVASGSVRMKAGTTAGGNDLLADTVYTAGVNELSIHPNKDVFFTFTSTLEGGAFEAGYLLLNSTGPIVLETPYTLEQAKKISFAQSADVLFMACAGVQPHTLKRYRHDSWGIEPFSFDAPIEPPTGVAVAFTNQAKDSAGNIVAAQLTANYTYYVTAVNADGRESEASAGASITGPAENNWKGGDYMTVTWEAVSGAVEYRIYKGAFGASPGYASVASGTTWRDYNVAAVMTDGPPKWDSPFPDNDWPGSVGIFEQRLVFASTLKRPQTIWFSRAGDYLSFSYSTPVKADDAIEGTIASLEVSRVQWMVPLRSLVLGTSSIEWEISEREAGGFSGTNMKVKPQSYRGSADIRAVVVGSSILFVARTGNELCEVKYDFSSDSYIVASRSILAEHLFEEQEIVQMAYQPAPNSIVWTVLNNGTLLGFTYKAEHEVFAWHKHTTQGLFRSVCSIPQGSNDRLYAAVKRGESYFLEVMAEHYTGGELSKAICLDSALLYDGEPSTTLTGLDHLEGLEVGILADGAVVPPRTVQSGGIELDAPASKAIVGLKYDAMLETMPIEILAQDGTSMGRKKQVEGVNVLFKDSVTAETGINFDSMEKVKWRTVEPYNTPPNPRTIFKRATVSTPPAISALLHVSACVRSGDPLPVTVLAISPEVSIK